MRFPHPHRSLLSSVSRPWARRLRVGAGGFAHGALVLTLVLAAGLTACRPKSASGSPDVKATVAFAHPPPAMGPNELTITLTRPDGSPASVTRLEVEGDMNHAGMKPTFANLHAAGPGHYAGTIEFTMGGDWFLLLSGERSDGSRFTQKVAVPGVESK